MRQLITVIFGLLLSLSSSQGAADTDIAAKFRAELAKLPQTEKNEKVRLVKEANLLFFLAKEIDNEEQKEKMFESGRDKALEVLKQDPKNPGALLWSAVNDGGLAEIHKNLAGLRTISRMQETMFKLKEIDPDYEYAAADRTLAKLYQEAPGFISIGSSSQARKHFLLAVKRFPDYPANQLLYAQFLYDKEEYEEAKKLVEAMLKGKEMAKHPLYQARWQIDGKETLAKIEAKLKKK
ncbi:MAG: hypothetical protein AB7P04_01990 [Bacteriovoracia bacterium]